jgi:hypothetical protein
VVVDADAHAAGPADTNARALNSTGIHRPGDTRRVVMRRLNATMVDWVMGFRAPMSTYGLVRKRHLSKNEGPTTKAVIHRSCPAAAPAVMDVPFSINCWRIPSVLAHCYYSSGGVSVLVRASSRTKGIFPADYSWLVRSVSPLLYSSQEVKCSSLWERLWLHQKAQTGI